MRKRVAKEVTEKKKQNNGGKLSELMRELWEAAVALRGTIEPADYKRYVLPVIFLRFLSLRYEKRRAELTAYVQEARAGYDVGVENLQTILNDSDEYRSGGAFMIPEDSRWDSIVANAQRDDIKTYIDDVLQLLEDTYPDKLRGLLPPHLRRFQPGPGEPQGTHQPEFRN